MHYFDTKRIPIDHASACVFRRILLLSPIILRSQVL